MKYDQDEILQSCYVFEISKGRKLELEPWSLASEQWANAHFGSYQDLLNKLFPEVDGNGKPVTNVDIDAIILTLTHQLNEDSQRKVDEWRGNKSREDFLATNITSKLLVGIAKVFYSMIRDSFPKDLKKMVEENAMQMLK